MKALITYASWFGHNRAIARALAQELASQRVAVICAPISKITAEDAIGLDLLVLGTYTHAGHANRRLRNLCNAIPHRRLEHLNIAIFGTHSSEVQQAGEPGGVDDLEAHLRERGVDIIAAPLRINLPGIAALLPWRGIGEAERRRIRMFARDLLEVCVPEPLA